jgi:putative ABC transport system permease protein
LNGTAEWRGCDFHCHPKPFFKKGMSYSIFMGLRFISLVLVSFVLPAFNLLTRKNIHIPFLNPFFWSGIAGLILITGIVSGSYPGGML